MRHRTMIAALAAATLATAAAAQAREVRFPAAHPQISLDAPDDWRIAETPLGLEMQSPQKDSLVLVGITRGDRPSVDGWAKSALARMAGEGVVFAKPGAAKPATPGETPKDSPKDTPKPAESAAAASSTATPKPVDPAAAIAAVARANGDRAYTFGGAPSIEPPKIVSEDTRPVAGRAGDVDLPTVSTLPLDPGSLRTVGHFLYAGGALRGQPVDVELTVYALGRTKRLLTEQQSGATDARGVTILRSVRDLTQ